MNRNPAQSTEPLPGLQRRWCPRALRQRRFLILAQIYSMAVLLVSSPLFFLRGVGVFDDSFFLKTGELVAAGAVPYRDFFENKTPATFYLAALIAHVGGGHWLAPRIFLFLLAIALSLAVVRYAWASFGPRCALVVSVAFPVSYVISQGYSLHAEQLLTLFGFLGVLCISGRRRESPFAWGVAGAAMGLAFLSKQSAATYLLGLLVAVSVTALFGRTKPRSAALMGGAAIIGFLVVLATAAEAAILLGIATEARLAIFDNARYVAVGVPIDLPMAARLWIKVPAILMAFASCVLLATSRPIREKVLAARRLPEILVWAALGLVSLAPNLRIQNAIGHYALPAVPGLALAGSFVLSLSLSRVRALGAVRRLVPVVALSPYLVGIGWGGFTMIREDRLRTDLRQMEEFRNLLTRHLPNDEPILCLSETQMVSRLYYLSGRRPYTRYLHFGVNFVGIFELKDAISLVDAGGPDAVIVEFPLGPDGRPDPSGQLWRASPAWRRHYAFIDPVTGVHPVLHTSTILLVRSRLGPPEGIALQDSSPGGFSSSATR